MNESPFPKLMPPPLLKMELLFVRSQRLPEVDGVPKIESTVEGEATVESIVEVTRNKATATGTDETWNGLSPARTQLACTSSSAPSVKTLFEAVLWSKDAMLSDSSTDRCAGVVKSQPVAPQYETDLAAWAVDQAQALRSGRYADIDAPNVAEELIGFGRRESDSVGKWLTVAASRHRARPTLKTFSKKVQASGPRVTGLSSARIPARRSTRRCS